MDMEFLRIQQEHSRLANCPHDNTEIREQTIRGGTTRHIDQCLDCGDTVGMAVKKVGEVPAFDALFKDRMEKKRSYLWGRIQQIREVQQKQRTSEWFQRHNEYLKTERWKIKRSQVLERAGHLCEGCRNHKAELVHHASYENHMDEFLFELIALCVGCHKKLHARKDAK